jgi:hypothetical protein
MPRIAVRRKITELISGKADGPARTSGVGICDLIWTRVAVVFAKFDQHITWMTPYTVRFRQVIPIPRTGFPRLTLQFRIHHTDARVCPGDCTNS